MNNDNDKKSDRIANDENYPVGPFVGALLAEPEPPKPGTFTLLLPENFTWGSKRRNGAIRNTERRYRLALSLAGKLQGPDELPTLEELKQAAAEHAEYKPAVQHKSSVEKWTAKVQGMLDKNAKPKAIYDRLRLEEQDFKGSLSAIKRLCARLKNAAGVRAADVAIPVTTQPGEVA